MGLRVEDRIDPAVPCQSKAVTKKLLDTLLTHASIEVTSDHDWRRSGHLADGSQHVLRTRGADATVAGVAVAAVNAPVCVKVPEGATAGQVPQLHPGHVPIAPLPSGLQVPGALRQHTENARLRHHALVVVEGRDSAVHVASARGDRPCVVALLQAERVSLHAPDVVDDAGALAGVLFEGIPPEEVVRDNLDPCASATAATATGTTQATCFLALSLDVLGSTIARVVATISIQVSAGTSAQTARLLALSLDVLGSTVARVVATVSIQVCTPQGCIAGHFCLLKKIGLKRRVGGGKRLRPSHTLGMICLQQ